MLWLALALAASLDRIAAVVDDEVITLTEVYDLGEPFVTQACPGLAEVCVAAAENEVLDSLIRRALIRQELTGLGLQVTASDVDSAIDRTVREFKLADRAELRSEVERSGKRWDTYREELFEYLRMQNFQGRVLAPRVSVTDDELRDMYTRNARRVVRQEVELDALGIVVPAGTSDEELGEMVAQAAALATAINAGTMTWSDAVRDYDGANLAVAVGGRAYKEGELVEALDGAIFAPSVVPGQAIGPVPVGQVLAILRVNDRRAAEGEIMPFEDVKEELRNQVFQEKLSEAEEEWYQRARREASVDIKL
jgi:peptidyl-prolyl cis-trans isomerase SurA